MDTNQCNLRFMGKLNNTTVLPLIDRPKPVRQWNFGQSLLVIASQN